MTSPLLLESVVLEPTRPADAAVIWLHGLGASGFDFPPIVPELGLPTDHGIRFVFPHAPKIPVTVNGGMVMPAWYDILAMDFDRKVDEPGVRGSAEHLARLIGREQERGIPPERVVLAGFSQGGAIALHQALAIRTSWRVWSCCPPTSQRIAIWKTSAPRRTPRFPFSRPTERRIPW